MLFILDRDGVINQDSDDYIKSPAEWQALPGSLEAIAKLNQAHHLVVIASNQSGVGRGYFDLAALNAIHEKMHLALAKLGGHIDAIYFCPHTPKVNCKCRKPKPGLLEQIKHDFPKDFASAIAIGDSMRDIEAAQALNLQTCLVLTGKGEKTVAEHSNELSNTLIFPDLKTAVGSVLKQNF